MNPRKVLLLPGDGIGPEVIAQATKVIEVIQPFLRHGEIELQEADFGGCAVDRHGEPLPAETLRLAMDSDATLLGAVGGPAYDGLAVAQRPEKGLLNLRKEMGVFANIRPISLFAGLESHSSLRPELIKGMGMVIYRELTGGIYFSEPRGIEGEGEQRRGYNTMAYSVKEIKRIAKMAFEMAMMRRRKLTSVDKANVLEVSRLWREVVDEMAADYPSVEVDHLYVDNAAMQMVRSPGSFDVILTGNIFGDILSDLAAELVGSIGMLPSASVNSSQRGLYEPVHGSAPDIAGKDIANPWAAILSVGLMLMTSLGEEDVASSVNSAVEAALQSGMRTADLCRQGEAPVSCTAMGQAVVDNLRDLLTG